MSKRMQLNGFTLVELLAIILIISIIALITAPIIFNVVENSKVKAFLDTAYTINKAATNYYASTATSDNTVPLLITYDQNKITSKRIGNSGVETTNINYLKYDGKHPYSGNIYIDEKGNVLMAIYDNTTNKCVEKAAEDKKPSLTEKAKNECHLTQSLS